VGESAAGGVQAAISKLRDTRIRGLFIGIKIGMGRWRDKDDRGLEGYPVPSDQRYHF
jgi:hypothetical protein